MPPIGPNPNMSRPGKENGRWKQGKSSDYRRRITNAKPGEIVHHKDKTKSNNKKSNFVVLKPRGGISARGVHNKVHPERNKNK